VAIRSVATPTPLRIVSVINKPVAVLLLQDRTVTRPCPTACACHDECSATFHHGLAASIDVWTSNTTRAADADVVGAVLSTATKVERSEKIVVVVFPNDVWSFDRARQFCASRTARE